MSKRRIIIFIAGISAGLLVLGSGAWLIYTHAHPKNAIPAVIAKQLDFTPRILTSNTASALSLAPQTYKYDAATKVLSFETLVESIKVVISEQPYPDILVYDKLVNAFNVYSEIDTKAGKVSLGRPKENNGGQAAVIHSDNLLIFGKPDKDLTDMQWKEIFNNLL